MHQSGSFGPTTAFLKTIKLAGFAKVFFQDIFPKLHLYFGDTMEDHVMVVHIPMPCIIGLL
ncbi:hypothetical protein K431DRAFT_286277 [Polychaeton citri CBS 116435]|uniref:Uncharacterized protein n=1 Tax=Polychaeton citri CBS 116435 TaxID=1314669 RepID=A0A9P4Q618_9PEZI|nr:hypothetical protein K431DRAFT_286277 [Polychaeton citri CBS 116435]